MNAKSLVYIVLEALIISLVIYIVISQNHIDVSDDIVSLSFDLTLNQDVNFAEEGIELNAGMKITPSFIVGGDDVCFYIEGCHDRLTLKKDYFLEKEEIDKICEQKTLGAKKKINEVKEKRKLISVVTLVLYLIFASIISYVFRDSRKLLVVHRVICGVFLVLLLFVWIN